MIAHFLIVVWIYQASSTDGIVFYLKENRSFALCLSFFFLIFFYSKSEGDQELTPMFHMHLQQLSPKIRAILQKQIYFEENKG